jgi:hypothetical protein
VVDGSGEIDGAGEVDGDGLAAGADGEDDGVALTDGDGRGVGLSDGVGVGLTDGDADGGVDGIADGDADGLADGVGDVGVDGEGGGLGSSFLLCASGATSAARTFGAPCRSDAGACVGDGAVDGAGAALGEGEGLVGTQNVPSLVHQPARPLRSTPGISSDFGGAVRAGAGVPFGAALGAGDVVAAGTDTGRVGVTQSSGCTIASPVAGSYSITRTPESRAHACSVASSVGARTIE